MANLCIDKSSFRILSIALRWDNPDFNGGVMTGWLHIAKFANTNLKNCLATTQIYYQEIVINLNMKKQYLIIALLALVFLFGNNCAAEERAAVKTNLLYDALLNVNLGAELKFAPHWSVDLSGNYNGWRLSNGRQWKHWMIQPELRYWTSRENMRGHFFAGHIFGGQFNTTLNKYRRQGWAAGAGIGYGYSWSMADHWGLEAEIALGYARYSYDKFPCADCGRKIADRNKNYVGPTKAAITLVYYFGGPKKETPVIVLPEVPVIQPVELSAIDTLPKFEFPLVDVPHSKILTENLAGTARVQFKVNRTEIDSTLADNKNELAIITGKLDSIRNNLGMDIHRIELIGYASPEGSYANNDRLASMRTVSLKSFIQSEMELPDSIIYVSHIAEDWGGLRNAIQESDIADKYVLIEIIDSNRSPDAKEALMKRHRASWAWISREILPSLRRTEYRIEYQHQYEEKELQTLEEVNRCITEGDIDEAAKLLVNIPSSPEADYARGVVAALQHRYVEAEAWFNRARSRGVEEAVQALHDLKTKTTK